MDVVNLHDNDVKFKKLNNGFFPDKECRIYIFGRTGSGKGVFVDNIIRRGWLCFDTLTVYARHLDQLLLEKLRDDIEELEDKRGEKMSQWFDSLNDVIPIEEYDKDKKHLVVFDDWSALSVKEHTPVTDYVIRGRHRGISIVYCGHAYHCLPKICREQCSMLILYAGSNFKDRETIYKDHLNGDLSFDEFEKIYKEATREKYSFLTIDLEHPDMQLRRGLDEVFVSNIITK
jgi:hypothetical protein